MTGHSHDHAHDHHDHSGGSRSRIGWAAVLTGSFMVAEAVGGLISGSLALLADAGHMLVDFAGLDEELPEAFDIRLAFGQRIDGGMHRVIAKM